MKPMCSFAVSGFEVGNGCSRGVQTGTADLGSPSAGFGSGWCAALGFGFGADSSSQRRSLSHLAGYGGDGLNWPSPFHTSAFCRLSAAMISSRSGLSFVHALHALSRSR